MSMLGLGDVALNVEIEGHGPPLLLLHGFSGSLHAWDDVCPLLADDATLVRVDLLGHGRSSAPTDPRRYAFEPTMADLSRLLDRLGYPQAHVLGYSMGGRLALGLAVRAPERVRTLILESASPGLDEAAERARRRLSDAALAERIERLGIDAFVAEWEALPLLQLGEHVAPDVRARQHAQRLANTPIGLANSLRGVGTGQQPSLWSALPRLARPVCLIAGQRDRRYCATAERMHARLPRATLAIVPQAGHTVHLDQPAAYVAHVRAAIDGRCVDELTR